MRSIRKTSSSHTSFTFTKNERGKTYETFDKTYSDGNRSIRVEYVHEDGKVYGKGTIQKGDNIKTITFNNMEELRKFSEVLRTGLQNLKELDDFNFK